MTSCIGHYFISFREDSQIDFAMRSFSDFGNNMCRKAANQIDALRRLSVHMGKNEKWSLGTGHKEKRGGVGWQK